MTTRKRMIRATALRDGIVLDFEDGTSAPVSEVIHLAHKVLFTARGTPFSVDRDELVCAVFSLEVVE